MTVPFELRYHPDVKSIDIPQLNGKLKVRMKTAIETRLATAPHQYGEPLRKTLHGYWKLRVGDYRVVFKIIGDAVLVMAIINRKDVYEAVGKRVERKGYARARPTAPFPPRHAARSCLWLPEYRGGVPGRPS